MPGNTSRTERENQSRNPSASLQGIHLINKSQDGVTIQFYMLLIVSLLQLRLKQQAMEYIDNTQSFSTLENPLQAEQVGYVFKITRLIELFTVCDDVASALEILESATASV